MEQPQADVSSVPAGNFGQTPDTRPRGTHHLLAQTLEMEMSLSRASAWTRIHFQITGFLLVLELKHHAALTAQDLLTADSDLDLTLSKEHEMTPSGHTRKEKYSS